MIDAIWRRTESYGLQDLKCSRCKQLKSDNMRAYCNCSGEYEMGEKKAELWRRLEVTKNVAVFHDLEYLLVSIFLPDLRFGADCWFACVFQGEVERIQEQIH